MRKRSHPWRGSEPRHGARVQKRSPLASSNTSADFSRHHRSATLESWPQHAQSYEQQHDSGALCSLSAMAGAPHHSSVSGTPGMNERVQEHPAGSLSGAGVTGVWTSEQCRNQPSGGVRALSWEERGVCNGWRQGDPGAAHPARSEVSALGVWNGVRIASASRAKVSPKSRASEKRFFKRAASFLVPHASQAPLRQRRG